MALASTIGRGATALVLSGLALSACAPGADGRAGGFAVSPGRMPAFCAGDAARRFDTDLTMVSTSSAVATETGHTVPGSFQLSSGDSIEFQCTFDSAGRFTGISGR